MAMLMINVAVVIMMALLNRADGNCIPVNQFRPKSFVTRFTDSIKKFAPHQLPDEDQCVVNNPSEVLPNFDEVYPIDGEKVPENLPESPINNGAGPFLPQPF